MKRPKEVNFEKNTKEEHYDCDLQAESPMNIFKRGRYIKSVINGKYSEVTVTDKTIIQTIIHWTENGDPINAFTKVLKQIGVQFPIKLRDYKFNYTNEFICETADGKQLIIEISCKDRPYMSVKENGVISYYHYLSHRVYLEIFRRIIDRNEIKLQNEYEITHTYSPKGNKIASKRKLTLLNGYTLNLDIHEYYNNQMLSQNTSDKIDLYLLSIATLPINSIYTWYEKIKEICQLDRDIMKSFLKFDMLLTKTISKNTVKTISRIDMVSGTLRSYTSTEKNKQIFWDNKGNWSLEEENKYEASCKDGEETVKVLKEWNQGSIKFDFSSLIKTSEEAVRKEQEKVIIP